MSQFNEGYLILTKAEFSNKPEKFLHKNKTENFLTIGGIYRKFHKTAIDWAFVDNITRICGYDIDEVSRLQTEITELKETIELDEFRNNARNERINELEYRLDKYNQSLMRASKMLYADTVIYEQVYKFFKAKFWDNIRLSEVHYQNTANEIFLSAVHIGVKRAVKLAQKTVGAKDDGILGDITLRCLNNYTAERFDQDFDKSEIAFYKDNNPDSKYLDGFIARATLV